LLGKPVVRLQAGSVYTDAGATAWDDRDGDISHLIEVTIESSVSGRVNNVCWTAQLLPRQQSKKLG